MTNFEDAFDTGSGDQPKRKRLTNVTERWVEVECCDHERRLVLYDFSGHIEDEDGNPRQVISSRAVPLTITRGGLPSPYRIQCARCMVELGRLTWLYPPLEGDYTSAGNALCPECLAVNEAITSKWFGLYAKLFKVGVW